MRLHVSLTSSSLGEQMKPYGVKRQDLGRHCRCCPAKFSKGQHRLLERIERIENLDYWLDIIETVESLPPEDPNFEEPEPFL